LVVVLGIITIFGGTGVWTQGFALVKQAEAEQVCYCLSHSCNLFSLVILEVVVSQSICSGWSQAAALAVSDYRCEPLEPAALVIFEIELLYAWDSLNLSPSHLCFLD
jgi:hypothetical protein